MVRWLHPRSLLSQVTWWIVLPLGLLVFGSVVAGVLAYRQTITSLLIDRDRQLAALSATRISEAVEGYARVLETLATNADVRSPNAPIRAAAIEDAAEILEIFNAGVSLADPTGQIVTMAPTGTAPLGLSVAEQTWFDRLRTNQEPAFSDVLSDALTGEDMIVIAVPIFDDAEGFAGVLCGAIHLHNTPLSEPVRRLNIGDEGFAYLVDGQGRVIFHPDATQIGADFSDRPFVLNVIAGNSGGTVWTTPTGERLVQGYSPVEATGWGLVIREPWEVVIEPARIYGLVATVASVVALLAAVALLWPGVRRISRPIQFLAAQSSRVASGQSLAPMPATGVLEIDQLEMAFTQMAGQIAAYRAGLRRYVGALTTAREDEQRRLARELHDETIQSLLAISRRIELYQGLTPPAAAQQLAHLTELRTLVADTLAGVRQISRDLRPLALEDLGLVPALRTMIQGWQRADPTQRLQVELKVAGPEIALSAEQELALYRIAQEALTNIRKHAQAQRVQIQLTFAAERAGLSVRDNGHGFQAPAALAELAQSGHFGLMGIQERVWAVGGTLILESTPERGTYLEVQLPLTPALPN